VVFVEKGVIGHQEPVRLRILEHRIPRDLETILMKAIEKDPKRRYPSAASLRASAAVFAAASPFCFRT
jgi:eukaryotic-like serine/threonine-protein kinase